MRSCNEGAFPFLFGFAVCLASTSLAASPGVPAVRSASQDYVEYAINNLPNYFANGPIAATDNTPADNPITNAGAMLGRVLFYDGRLSHNNGTSCASCHQQSTGFGDSAQFSEGFEGGLTPRHSTALANAAYYERGRFFWDERAETLEEQVLMPIQDELEMGTDLDQLREELAATDFYPKLFEEAFGTPEITNERISKSLAQFIRSMKSYQSKYDQAVQAGTPANPDFDSVFTPLERQGADLFLHGAGRCATCHSTHAQVADRPHNTGLDLDNSDPNDDIDDGVGDGSFKVMSLRNVAVRERFMHDGRFSSLEEVIEFYNSGIQDNPDLDRGLRVNGEPLRLNMTDQEKAALVAFLETLTDETFLTSELFSDPFEQLPGDYDGSGVVDSADYLIWKQDFGLTDSWADGNLDGTVNLADYTIWRNNLGATWEGLSTSTSLQAASVPEPSSMVLFCAAGLGLLGWRRVTSRRFYASSDR
ncbi:cytochrome c peroxidase [Aeoliella sp.]|uniref:cytochrome c peroxidase n=1 Tax=Aeoliella sp. TaxID=2795800 RepID=UPI003CCC3982